MDNIYPKCRLCGNPAVGGFYDGIYLKRVFICGKCEETISRAEAEMSGEYEELVAAIKQLPIFPCLSRGKSGNSIAADEKTPSI